MGMLAIVALAACGSRSGVVVTRFEVSRTSWDTLRVNVAFGARRLLGDPRPIRPDETTLHVFDAAFDTLYAGPDRVIPIPDADLGSEERLLVEVCGAFGAHRVCEQRALRASPKRVLAEPDIEYPVDERFERGRFHFGFAVERRRFGAETWEPVARRRPVEGFILAYVDAEEGAPVRVPFSRSRGRFNLASHDHYRDFKYALQTELFDGKEAAVRFDVYADLMGTDEPLTTVEKRIVRKTDEERMAEVAAFVREAGARVLERLGIDPGRRRVYVFVDEWAYDPGARLYTVVMELHWASGFFSRRWHELDGRLVVDEDGREARFERTRANDDAERRWRERVPADTLRIPMRRPPGEVEEGTVEPEPPRRKRVKTW
ncbi:hypothetical protein [Rhodocaloribacter sp.]